MTGCTSKRFFKWYGCRLNLSLIQFQIMLETLAKQMVYSVTLAPLMEKAQKR